MSVKFVKHPSFPQNNCRVKPSGWFWFMQMREWAFAQLDVEAINEAAGLKGTSSNHSVVLDHTVGGEKGVKTTNTSTGSKTTATGTVTYRVKFFANAQGGAYIQLFDKNPIQAVDGSQMQVQVLQRRATSPKDISLTKLEGKTYAISAPDAKAYTMDAGNTFSAAAINPLSFFATVPSDTNHVVISSHAGVPTEGDKHDPKKLCLFVCGLTLETLRLDLGNVEDVFKTLKGKVAANCVVWFGGCNIGANDEFCKKAVKASGCTIVAPANRLVATKYPNGHVDMIDNFAGPKVFGPPDGDLMKLSDFCAKQATYKFIVPP